MLVAGEGIGIACRKTNMSAMSESDTTLLVYGGISFVGCRMALANAETEIAGGPIRGPAVCVEP